MATFTPEARPSTTHTAVERGDGSPTWSDAPSHTWNDLNSATWLTFLLKTLHSAIARPATTHTPEARP